jgi:hypothetical protein
MCSIAVRQYFISYDRLGNDGHVLVVQAFKLKLINVANPDEFDAWAEKLASKPRTQRRDRSKDSGL